MRVLRRIGVFSLAKFMSITLAGFAFVVGLVYGFGILLFTVLAAVGMVSSGSEDALMGGGASVGMGVVGAIVVVVALPLFYGIMGFLMGLIYGLIVNLALRVSGGLEFEVEALD